MGEEGLTSHRETMHCPIQIHSGLGAPVEVGSTCCLHSDACTAAEQVPVSTPAAAMG